MSSATAIARGKMTPGKVLLHPHKAPKAVKRLFDEIEGQEERVELNLYVVGYEPEPEGDGAADREPPPDKSPTFPGPQEGSESSESESS